MRVTNQLLERSMLRHLSDSLRNVVEAQEKVATGIRVATASDDPAAASLILDIDHQLRNLNQFQRQTAAARARIMAEDSVLDQVQQLTDRARQLAVGGSTDSSTSASMAAAAAEISQIIGQIHQAGNTKIGDEYIFGGFITDSQPFQGGVYMGDLSVRQLEINDGVLVDTAHNADQMFISTGLLQSLTDLQTALQSGDPAQVRAIAPNLDVAARNMLTIQAEVGARMSMLDDSDALRQQMGLDLDTRRSELAEVDFEKATTEFVTAQTVLQAARAAVGHVLQNTLTDFLR